jgi:hypothetical protein
MRRDETQQGTWDVVAANPFRNAGASAHPVGKDVDRCFRPGDDLPVLPEKLTVGEGHR